VRLRPSKQRKYPTPDLSHRRPPSAEPDRITCAGPKGDAPSSPCSAAVVSDGPPYDVRGEGIKENLCSESKSLGPPPIHRLRLPPPGRLIHIGRLALDGVLPEVTNRRGEIPDPNNGGLRGYPRGTKLLCRSRRLRG
jgi:hypothetical protein